MIVVCGERELSHKKVPLIHITLKLGRHLGLLLIHLKLLGLHLFGIFGVYSGVKFASQKPTCYVLFHGFYNDE